eukprot:scaffold116528_cov48-Phaeocystis_antarctica.AAC.1
MGCCAACRRPRPPGCSCLYHQQPRRPRPKPQPPGPPSRCCGARCARLRSESRARGLRSLARGAPAAASARSGGCRGRPGGCLELTRRLASSASKSAPHTERMSLASPEVPRYADALYARSWYA